MAKQVISGSGVKKPSAQKRGAAVASAKSNGKRKTAAVVAPKKKKLLLSDLGITREQAIDLRARLMVFAEDWDVPEMDAYDEL